MSRLVTSRLVLRPIERADIGALDAWYTDRDVMRYIGDGHTYSSAETRICMHRYLDDAARQGFGVMIAELRDTGEPIGRFGYMTWDVDGTNLVEIGWLVATSHQGNGYATEAGAALRNHGFGAMGLDMLISVIQHPNKASIRVAEKLGGEYWQDWVTPGGIGVALYRFDAPV